MMLRIAWNGMRRRHKQRIITEQIEGAAGGENCGKLSHEDDVYIVMLSNSDSVDC